MCEDNGGRFNESFSACEFFAVVCKTKVEISLRAAVPFFEAKGQSRLLH